MKQYLATKWRAWLAKRLLISTLKSPYLSSGIVIEDPCDGRKCIAVAVTDSDRVARIQSIAEEVQS